MRTKQIKIFFQDPLGILGLLLHPAKKGREDNSTSANSVTSAFWLSRAAPSLRSRTLVHQEAVDQYYSQQHDSGGRTLTRCPCSHGSVVVCNTGRFHVDFLKIARKPTTDRKCRTRLDEWENAFLIDASTEI